MQYVLSNEPNMSKDVCHRYAIFYSIFRLQHATLKGAGAIAIKKGKRILQRKMYQKILYT